MSPVAKDPVIYSIGHSSQTLPQFVALLKQVGVQTLIDVRSQPYSRYSPQFNLEGLELDVEKAGISFLYKGHDLGGRPRALEFYDIDGRVLYSCLAQAGFFRDGIETLVHLASEGVTAVMCSEEDPAPCHRRLLIGRVLDDEGVRMVHIRGTGRIEEDTTYGRRAQMSLLTGIGDDEWKSLRSVLPSARQPIFSEH